MINTQWLVGLPESRWETEITFSYWDAGEIGTTWMSDVIYLEWTVPVNSQLSISQLSTEYVLVPVAVTKAGVPYNPTGDTVQFAFMPNPVQVPVNADWVDGAWDTDSSNIIYPYSAKCLVGPNGTTSLQLGTYVIYIKITDNPETPVLTAGQLIVS